MASRERRPSPYESLFRIKRIDAQSILARFRRHRVGERGSLPPLPSADSVGGQVTEVAAPPAVSSPQEQHQSLIGRLNKTTRNVGGPASTRATADPQGEPNFRDQTALASTLVDTGINFHESRNSTSITSNVS